jgi:hypothetical protein
LSAQRNDGIDAKTIVTDVAGDYDQKNQEVTAGDFGAPHCS